MKQWVVRLVVLGAVCAMFAAAGLFVSATGIIPVKASSRHWAITEWFLHFSMRRSIAMHSLGIQRPDIDAPGMILRGATHYDIGCRSCHGSPGGTLPRIAYQMTPPPPELKSKVHDWSPEELFSIVKHGIKFTGMPAWPTQKRDDEVWAVVAFLWKLPEIDAAKYRELVGGEPEPTAPIATMDLGQQSARALNQTCIRCHGSDGLGRGADAFPKIAGQRREYLENALKSYALDMRPSGMMGPLSAALDPSVIRELSEYYAQLSPEKGPSPILNPSTVERGRVIATAGVAKQRVPACVECHGPNGKRAKPAYHF